MEGSAKEKDTSKNYLVCIPGTAAFSVETGESEKGAVASFAVRNGIPVGENDPDVTVGVVEFNAVKVDRKAVKEILNPEVD